MKVIMVLCFVMNYHKNQFDRDVEVINKLFEFEKENKESNACFPPYIVTYK